MTLSALGIFSAAGAGGVVAEPAYELITTQILGSASPTITFSSLGTYSSTYKHLQLRIASRSGRSAENDPIFLRFNSDSGSNYAYHEMGPSGGGVYSAAGTSQTSVARAGSSAGSTAAANAFGASVIDILDAYSTTKNKTTRTLMGVGGNTILLTSGAWFNTASITTITLTTFSATDFVTGSRFSLYGIKG
jgi:hypothetical protein